MLPSAIKSRRPNQMIQYNSKLNNLNFNIFRSSIKTNKFKFLKIKSLSFLLICIPFQSCSTLLPPMIQRQKSRILVDNACHQTIYQKTITGSNVLIFIPNEYPLQLMITFIIRVHWRFAGYESILYSTRHPGNVQVSYSYLQSHLNIHSSIFLNFCITGMASINNTWRQKYCLFIFFNKAGGIVLGLKSMQNNLPCSSPGGPMIANRPVFILFRKLLLTNSNIDAIASPTIGAKILLMSVYQRLSIISGDKTRSFILFIDAVYPIV